MYCEYDSHTVSTTDKQRKALCGFNTLFEDADIMEWILSIASECYASEIETLNLEGT